MKGCKWTMFVVGHSYTRLRGVTNKEILGLADALWAYTVPDLEKRLKLHRKVHPVIVAGCPKCNWDGVVRLYSYRNGNLIVPSGLFLYAPPPDDYQVCDKRIFQPLRQSQPTISVQLRDYQYEAFSKAIAEKRGIIGAPTGSGKTIIIGALASVLPTPTLIICHTVSLGTQLRNMLSDLLGHEIGFAGAGILNLQPITVALLQTLWSKRRELSNYFPTVQTIIVDECHRTASRTYYKTIQSCHNAGYRFGFSATPYRSIDEETLWLIAALGKLIHQVPIDPLIERGYLAEPQVLFIKVKDAVPATANKDWKQCYYRGIVMARTRNLSIVYLVKSGMQPCLILVWRVEHGELLRAMLANIGVKCDFISGDDNPERREQAKRALLGGQLQALIATDIFKEGIDIPNVPYLINAAGFKSNVATLQRVGRALRPKPDGSPATIVDFYDKGNYLLEHHSKKRLEALQKTFGRQRTLIVDTYIDVLKCIKIVKESEQR